MSSNDESDAGREVILSLVCSMLAVFWQSTDLEGARSLGATLGDKGLVLVGTRCVCPTLRVFIGFRGCEGPNHENRSQNTEIRNQNSERQTANRER